MKRVQKGLAVWLCLCLALSFTGCGKEMKETESQNPDVSQSLADTQEEHTTEGSPTEPEKDEFMYVPSFQTVEGFDFLGPDASLCGNVLYTERRVRQPEGDGFRYELWSLDLNTLETEQLTRSLGEEEYIEKLVKLSDQTLVLLTRNAGELSEGDRQFFFVFCDERGEEIRRQDITMALSGDGKRATGELYAEDMEADSQDNIYVMLGGMDTAILGFDSRGQLLFTEEESGLGSGLYRNESGQVFCIGDKRGAGGNSCVLRRLDAASGGLDGIWEGLPDQVDKACFAGDDTLLLSSGNTLYRYDMTAQSREEVLNWINMDITAGDIQLLSMLPDGRILVLDRQYDDGGDRLEAAYLTWTPVSEVTQKTMITLGGLSINYYISEQVIAFNKRSDSCRILLKEYGKDEAGRLKLQADLLAGKGPDILDLAAVNGDAMIARGFLTDLYPLMEGCPDTKKEDFLENILSIYERDGALYGIVPGFHILSLMGKVSVVGEESGWSVADVQTLMQERPEAHLFYASSLQEAFQKTLMLNMGEFVDWSSGTCSFDSAGFESMLEFGSMLSAEEQVRREDDFMERLARDEVLLLELRLYDTERYQLHCAFYEYEPVNCIGYPSPDGRGTVLEPWLSLGILESCSDKEEAWEFISWLLADEFQLSGSGFLPVRESSLKKQFDAAMAREESRYSYNNMGFDIPPATEEDVRVMRQMIDTGRGVSPADRMILQIIDEEAAAYFAGQKPAAEVAKIIQSRVQLYMDENR
ncbi:MAG: extracellular solute-binding protein [Lachnospiraceae bacterium]|nr:extracellular solute-binding protein [Lachnospiraceae bacterium]